MPTFTNDGGSDDGISGSTAVHDKNGVLGRNDDTTPRNAATPEGNGVFGITQVPDGAGVFGLHNSGGVGVAGFGHPAGIGVVGMSVPAGAKGGDGVLGVTNSEHRNGMVGRNDSATPRSTAEPGGNGIFGFTQVPDGSGVFGLHASTGIGVAGLGLIGVSGGSVNGVGVMGVSAPPGAKGGDGVQGITNSEFRNGVYGRNDSATRRGNQDPAGNGVFGYSVVPDGAGVLGAHGGGQHGVFGTGGFGVTGVGTVMGVWGQGKGTGWAGYFTGPVEVDGNLSVTGDVILTGGGDIAETFRTEPSAVCDPGVVMVMSEHGTLIPCDREYDKRVIGVVSGAGSLRPAITLAPAQRNGPSASVALVGTVYCRVDAEISPIETGDLLTTSGTPGHAAKATDFMRSFGAIVGKALAPLTSGRGLIPILLARQ